MAFCFRIYAGVNQIIMQADGILFLKQKTHFNHGNQTYCWYFDFNGQQLLQTGSHLGSHFIGNYHKCIQLHTNIELEHFQNDLT